MRLKSQKVNDSQEDLINCENGDAISVSELSLIDAPSDIILTQAEREYLLHVQRGDVSSVQRQLDKYKDRREEMDKDCLDPLARSAIVIAIENENIKLLEVLLEQGVKPKDALLHAITEHYVEGVEVLLQWEEEHHVTGQPYSWEAMTRDAADFTKDITPLILAGHHNHYEILKLLLDRGASLPMPHDVRCGCEECVISTDSDSLRHSLSRINAYKSLSSPSLISLSSKDPILTSFELSAELKRLVTLEHEFKTDYIVLTKQVKKFVTDLLNQIRTKKELTTLLNYEPENDSESNDSDGETNSLQRLKLAIRFSQKSFVAHSNVQQLLGAIWYNGLPGFRRKSGLAKCMSMMKIMCSFPILSIAYIIDSDSTKGKYIKKPFVKFLCNVASYMMFLTLLALASQRIEYLLIEWFGNAWLQGVLKDWKAHERGCLPGLVETLIIIYVFALIWSEMKSLYNGGLLEYIDDLWNIVDYGTNMFFMVWILLRVTAWIIVQRDFRLYDSWPWYPREEWDAFDPMLISEGCFCAAIIISYLKLVNIFSINPHLGPLQISLGRMIFDILKFFFLYTLVLFAFGCGLNQLMWYYAELEMQNCYHLPNGLPDYDNERESCIIWRRFTNLFESSQSLFWASFGLVELPNFELSEIGSFTRFWALLMFGSYCIINVIVLLNLLIAMMSNSYNLIKAKSDTEWKFARTKLWLSYFEDGSTVPPPFNLIPSVKSLKRMFSKSESNQRGSFKNQIKKNNEMNHMNVMRLLVRRYITEQQRQADARAVTEDEINEVKQDISTFRYELMEILKNNGMNTSMASSNDPNVVSKRGRALERKLMKGFNIGLVEGIFNQVLTEAKKPSNIFGKLAKAIGKKGATDWNAKVSRASIRMRDQIGSSELSLKRSHTCLKKRIQVENEKLLGSMNPDHLVVYNPNLEYYSPATRVAYAKFKVNTLKVEQGKRNKEIEKEAQKSGFDDQTKTSIENPNMSRSSVQQASGSDVMQKRNLSFNDSAPLCDIEEQPQITTEVNLKTPFIKNPEKEVSVEDNKGIDVQSAKASGENLSVKSPNAPSEEDKVQEVLKNNDYHHQPEDSAHLIEKGSNQTESTLDEAFKIKTASDSIETNNGDQIKVTENTLKGDISLAAVETDKESVTPHGTSKMTGKVRTGWL